MLWNLYLTTNGLLLVSFVAFFLARALVAFLRLRTGTQDLVRAGQALVLVSILAPGLMALLPGPTLPELPVPAFRSGGEGGRLAHPSAARVKIEQSVAAVSELAEKGWEIPTPGLPQLCLLLIFLFLTRFAIRARKLLSLLHSSPALRSLGKVRVLLAAEVAVPFSAWAFGRHYVVLPENLLANRRDLKLALRHELQHLRQGDALWAVLAELLTALFFWNPALYAWKRRIVELQEFSCDEALVGQRGASTHEYGSCLVRVAEAALGARDRYAGTAYMAAHSGSPRYFKSFLRRRIEMLMKRKARTHRWAGAGIGTMAALCTVAIAYSAETADRKQKLEAPNKGELILDPRIQEIAEGILQESVKTMKAKEGFAIVADPQTGRILAVAEVSKRPKGPHWLAKTYEPASIAKTLVVAQAIEDGKTTPEEKHNCEEGSYKYQDQIFHDWKEGGFKQLSTTEAIAISSDICTVKIAERLGDEGVEKMLKNFGIGPEGTAKSFPYAHAGRLPGKNWPKRHLLVPYVAYGQGFKASPIEMVQAYGAIANGGNLLAPLPATAGESDKKVIRRVLSEISAEKVKKILREVVLSGTAKNRAASELYSTAGKTATSYSPDQIDFAWSKGVPIPNLAGFIGFAPVKNPRVEVYVRILDPHTGKDGAHGSEHAAPVFRKIAEAVLKEWKVAPDR